MRRKLVLIILVMLSAGVPEMQSAMARSSAAAQEEPALTVDAPAATEAASWRRWSAPRNISQCPTDRATYPSLAAADYGRAIYLAWTDGRALAKDIYYAKSVDGGWSWQNPTPVYPTAKDSWRPSLAVSGGNAYVAWADSLSAISHDTKQIVLGGGSPSTVANTNKVLAYMPRLAAGPGGELHLALQGGLGTSPDILYSRKAAGASSWPAAAVVFTHTGSGSHNPAIAVSADGQTVHLVWQENFSGDQSEIFYMRGQWSGGNIAWQPAVTLSQGITRSVRPSILIEEGSGSGSRVHVAWGEQTSGYSEQYVRYIRSDNGGVSWGTTKRVLATPVSANNVAPTDIAPSLARTPSGALCVAWHGFLPDASIEAEDVYLSCSTDLGVYWSLPVNISRSAEVISIRPALAVAADGILHLAWQELAGGDPVTEYQIFYAHSAPNTVMLPLISR
jgi:hypothetical protein